MKTHSERYQQFAEIHSRARVKAHRTQEWMAKELDITRKTVQNWESGVSSPSFFQSLEWFRVLNINPFSYYLSLIHPYELNIKPGDSDEKVEKAFETLIKDISIDDKRALLYLYYGDHGSNPYSVIQLMLAHLHLPILPRVDNAHAALHKYEIYKAMDELICKDNIQPNVEELKKAIARAEKSAISKEYGYNTLEEHEE